MNNYSVTTFAEVSELIDVVSSFLTLAEGGDLLTFPRCWQALGTMRLVNSQWHAEATPRLWGMLTHFVSSVPLLSVRSGTWLARERRRFQRSVEASSSQEELTFGMAPVIPYEKAAKELMVASRDDTRIDYLVKIIDTVPQLKSTLICGAPSVCFVDYLLLASAHPFCRMAHADFNSVRPSSHVDCGVVYFSFKSTVPEDPASRGEKETTYLEEDAREYFEGTAAYDKHTEMVDLKELHKEFDRMRAKDWKTTPKFDSTQITMTEAIDYMVEYFESV